MKNTHKIITYCTIECVCYMYLTNLCYCIWNLIYLKRNKWPHQFELFYGEEKLYVGSWKIMMLNRIHVLYHKSLSNWLLKGVTQFILIYLVSWRVVFLVMWYILILHVLNIYYSSGKMPVVFISIWWASFEWYLHVAFVL